MVLPPLTPREYELVTILLEDVRWHDWKYTFKAEVAEVQTKILEETRHFEEPGDESTGD